GYFSSLLTNAAKANNPQGLAAQIAADYNGGLPIKRIGAPHQPICLTQPPHTGEHQGNCQLCCTIGYLIGQISNSNPPLCCSLQIEIVQSHPVVAEHFQVGQFCHFPGTNSVIAHQDRICV